MEIKRVQGLSQSGITNVPRQYIQPPDNRPTTQTPPDDPTQKPQLTIPTIDLFQFDPARKQSVITSITDACKHWGAFHVTNHGVPLELLHEMRNVGLWFFEECSTEEKMKYSCDSSSAASEGYGSKMLVSDDGDGDGGVLDWRDYFDHHTLPLQRRDPSRWPQFPSNYREVVVEYSDHMKVLAQKLLGLISETLGLPSSCIEEAVGEFYQNITISYYPPCPQPDLTLGLQSHSDFGVVTLLIQDDVGGLQVFKDTEWITVHPLSDAILVILSDQTEILTNGVYRSAQHRAITNSRRARLSVATFHDPAKSINLSPLPKLISESSRPKYRPIKYGDYVSSWYTKGPEGKRNLDALLIDY